MPQPASSRNSARAGRADTSPAASTSTTTVRPILPITSSFAPRAASSTLLPHSPDQRHKSASEKSVAPASPAATRPPHYTSGHTPAVRPLRDKVSERSILFGRPRRQAGASADGPSLA